MHIDPIVEEIRAHRAAISAESNHDLSKIFAVLKANEAKSMRQLVRRPPRPLVIASSEAPDSHF